MDVVECAEERKISRHHAKESADTWTSQEEYARKHSNAWTSQVEYEEKECSVDVICRVCKQEGCMGAIS